MSTEPSRSVVLQESDFRRLGVRRQECRLGVIRRAAAGRAAELIRRHQQSPSPRDQEQLSQLAVSTYRLLDPRQRAAVSQRVHIGRVLRPEQLDEHAPRFAPQCEIEQTRSSLRTERAVAVGWFRRLVITVSRGVAWAAPAPAPRPSGGRA